MNLHIVAIVPALNEASTIAQVITGLRNRIARVTVVDDGSSDATADIALAAGATLSIRRLSLSWARAPNAEMSAARAVTATRRMTVVSKRGACEIPSGREV